MPELSAFRGLRYAHSGSSPDITVLVAPPYDVVDEDERKQLEARNKHNAVHVELPQEDGGTDRYANARCLLDEWQREGVLVLDDAPSLTVYRMSYTDENKRGRHTLGVLGALSMSDGGLLPHEHTTPKAKDDRLNLLRTCRTNVSPIWALAPTPGLSALIAPAGEPDAAATDDDGVLHQSWKISEPALIDKIGDLLRDTPVIVADGHHRYEVARAYRDERRAATGDRPGDYDAVLAYVVELDDEQLTVGAIHRLVSGLPPDYDLVTALARYFVAERLEDDAEPQGLAVVTRDGAWQLRPHDETAHALDSSRVAEALSSAPEHTLTYQHGRETVLAAVRDSGADAAFLLRPATVEQIADTGRSGTRMPPKTTFFWPKPRTGMVFRPVKD